MGSHSVTCHLAVVTFPPLLQPKLVLNLETRKLPRGDTRLSWPRWWLHPKIVYLPKTVTYLRNNQAVSWPGLEQATWKSQVQRPNYYTTKPPGNSISHCAKHGTCQVTFNTYHFIFSAVLTKQEIHANAKTTQITFYNVLVRWSRCLPTTLYSIWQ